MTAMARKTDLKTSHAAAKDFTDSGRLGKTQVAARQLVKRYPGYTYRHLYDRHLAECKRKGVEPVFMDPPSLMRRLSEVAVQEGVKRCPLSGRTVSRWYPR